MVTHRRLLVDERTGLTNRLQALLKQYFPQALQLCGEDLWRPISTALLLKWSSLQAIQAARPETIRQFYYTNGSRSKKLIDQRLELIAHAVPLLTDPDLIAVHVMRLKLLLRQIQLVAKAIESFEGHIAEAFQAHPDRLIFDSLPGAGKTLAPRLLATVGSQRERFPTAASLLCYSGIAPVTKQSGNKRYVHRRYLCSKFQRQSFHEWAKQSILHCHWAAAYYEQQKARGVAFNTIIRALAYKWIRILWRMWITRTPYDDVRYTKALARSRSPLIEQIKSTPIPCNMRS